MDTTPSDDITEGVDNPDLASIQTSPEKNPILARVVESCREKLGLAGDVSFSDFFYV